MWDGTPSCRSLPARMLMIASNNASTTCAAITAASACVWVRAIAVAGAARASTVDAARRSRFNLLARKPPTPSVETTAAQ